MWHPVLSTGCSCSIGTAPRADISAQLPLAILLLSLLASNIPPTSRLPWSCDKLMFRIFHKMSFFFFFLPPH